MTDPEKTLEDDLFGMEPAHDERGPRIVWQPRELPGCRDLALASAGVVTFAFVDGIMMWAPLTTSASSSPAPQALILLLLAFGLGGLLAWRVGGKWRPYGFGMMAGWLVLTLLSAGYLTGISP
jgi:hypothetical protein